MTDTPVPQTREDDRVRGLLDAWCRAVNAMDLDAIFDCYTPDIVAFDAILQLRFKGALAYRKHWRECLDGCGAMRFEIHDLETASAGDVAFAHYLARCGGTGPDGTEHDGWMRATVGCREVAGRWLVTHEHFSAPFDPMSGKSLFELQP